METKPDTTQDDLTEQRCELCDRLVWWDKTPHPVHDRCLAKALDILGIDFSDLEYLKGKPPLANRSGDVTHELVKEAQTDGGAAQLQRVNPPLDMRKIKIT